MHCAPPPRHRPHRTPIPVTAPLAHCTEDTAGGARESFTHPFTIRPPALDQAPLWGRGHRGQQRQCGGRDGVRGRLQPFPVRPSAPSPCEGCWSRGGKRAGPGPHLFRLPLSGMPGPAIVPGTLVLPAQSVRSPTGHHFREWPDRGVGREAGPPSSPCGAARAHTFFSSWLPDRVPHPGLGDSQRPREGSPHAVGDRVLLPRGGGRGRAVEGTPPLAGEACVGGPRGGSGREEEPGQGPAWGGPGPPADKAACPLPLPSSLPRTRPAAHLGAGRAPRSGIGAQGRGFPVQEPPRALAHSPSGNPDPGVTPSAGGRSPEGRSLGKEPVVLFRLPPSCGVTAAGAPPVPLLTAPRRTPGPPTQHPRARALSPPLPASGATSTPASS